MTMLEPNVELKTSTQHTNQFHDGNSIMQKIAWMVMKKERPPQSSYYPLPPRK
ncbi:hypothetical protein MHZ95_15805 [Sporosarcina sp. ACRSM]|uniref:hypothetical protein n=1 Tax=Sporosarcina sp. ACRSM TaxID=2918216 RepID=UPI001EF6EE75|nr:hypothetical protein [Sporosarcina sp. ACRSM]MCG7336732.1 hypothetical protein [Sporosarcina sp. ACRSM]